MTNEQREIFMSASDYMKKFIPGMKQICKEFQRGEIGNINDFVNAMEGFAWLMEVLELTTGIHNIEIEYMLIEKYLEQVNEFLDKSAYECVADITVATLVPLVEIWSEEIESVLGEVPTFLN